MGLRLLTMAAAGERIHNWKPEIPGFYAILRAQSRISRGATLTSHIATNVESRREEGIGLQLFAHGGRTVFVSSDSLEDSDLDNLMEQGLRLLQAHPEVPNALTANFALYPKAIDTRFMTGANAAARSPHEMLELVRDIHEELNVLTDANVRSTASTFTAVDDEWRIFRSDGTDIHFNTWRTSFVHRLTLTDGGASTSVRESVCGKDASFIQLPQARAQLMDRVRRRKALGLAVLRGTPLAAGHYNIILESGMAKGLAHEAFGHACESDQVLEGSALTANKKYLVGEQLAPEGVSIVDFPMEGDWADQPFSANGFRRQTVPIVENGQLKQALTDVFSGPALGLPLTGAERVERYDCVPLPRMTNIRLELANAVPWDKEFGMVGADELYEFLLEQQLVERDETWLYLEGYRGGQVNTITGDYVFNCTAIHRFEHGEVSTHPPAIFSGQVLKTLAAVRAAVGPLELMCQGMCGKDGQRVPSSGGGHLFTLFNASEGITIGGC